MTLGTPGEGPKPDKRPVLTTLSADEQKAEPAKQQPVVLPDELQPVLMNEAVSEQSVTPVVTFTNEEISKITVDNIVEKKQPEEKIEWVLSQPPVFEQAKEITAAKAEKNSPASAVSGGYLARPSNIYAEEPKSQKESRPEVIPVKESVLDAVVSPGKEEEPSDGMQLVFKEDTPAADEPRAYQTPVNAITADLPTEEPAMQDEVEEQKRRASERINKLRNFVIQYWC